VVRSTGFRPYAQAGPVTLHFPGARVEVVGLHESGHDGALPQVPASEVAPIGRLDSRRRGTHGQGAADIVMSPTSRVRAPVTGTVLRAGTYTLYCDHVDQYLVIEPDARPGWEVKVLHVTGLAVAKGDRVRAGVSVVATGARALPFASQVDRHTAAPHWPHVHIEVVDPTVPDRTTGRTCD
jgi:murein DD-endopeptidase MepM/ murein hydrolase activator NlpD